MELTSFWRQALVSDFYVAATELLESSWLNYEPLQHADEFGPHLSPLFSQPSP